MCANGRVGGMGGYRDCLLMVWVGERERFFIDGMGGMGAEMGSSIVMYNLGVGPWGTL